MAASSTAVTWNNQWWTEVVHKKEALEPMVNTKEGVRYKTDAEMEVKQLRRGLLNIKNALVGLVNDLEGQNISSEAEEILLRKICAIQHHIETLT